MRISTKSRYAVSAMLHLALNRSKRPVTLSYLCEKQNISLSYLEQLFGKLREKGLVRGVRGPGGGYHLADSPDAISIEQIMDAVDGGQVEYDPEKIPPGMDKAEQYSASNQLWDDLSQQISTFLSEITLGDLAQRSVKNQDDSGSNSSTTTHVDLTDQAA